MGWYDEQGREVSSDILYDAGKTIKYVTTVDATYYARFEKKANEPVKPQIPGTGDNSKIVLCITLLLISGMIMLILFIIRKNKKQ